MNKFKIFWLFIVLLSTIFMNWYSFAEKQITTETNSTNTRVDNSKKTTLRLSDDIGKMADRIWVMADRILEMADKILKTQEIQSKNLMTTENNVLEWIKLLNTTLKQNNKLLLQMIKLTSNMMWCMCKK